MEKYKITVFRQSRILLCLFLLPIFVILIIFISAEINLLLTTIPLFSILIISMYYFSVGNLEIFIKDNEEMIFEWEKKFIFNYKPISPVKISDIQTIVVDNNQFIRKIKTCNRKIFINNSKIQSKDAKKLLLRLRDIAVKYDIKIINSWMELAKKKNQF